MAVFQYNALYGSDNFLMSSVANVKLNLENSF